MIGMAFSIVYGRENHLHFTPYHDRVVIQDNSPNPIGVSPVHMRKYTVRFEKCLDGLA